MLPLDAILMTEGSVNVTTVDNDVNPLSLVMGRLEQSIVDDDLLDDDLLLDLDNEPTVAPQPDQGPEYVTAVEAQRQLNERREQVRHWVLRMADRRSWCDEGTRKVLAGLRLPRPGNRTRFMVRIPVSMVLTFQADTWTAQGAVERSLIAAGLANTLTDLGSPVGDERNINNGMHITGSTAQEVAFQGPILVNGEPVDLNTHPAGTESDAEVANA